MILSMLILKVYSFKEVGVQVLNFMRWVLKDSRVNIGRGRDVLRRRRRVKTKRIIGIKRLLDDLRVTAAQLMLLVYKLLLLVFKVNAAGIKVKTIKRLQLLEEFMLTEKRSKTYQRKNKDCLKIKITYVIRIIIYRIDY
ncbi:hypothetical protein Tco_0275432 [Tanacetum coccineum]